MASITFSCLWVPGFNRWVSIYNWIYWKWPLAPVQTRHWTLVSGSEGESPVSLPPPASSPHKTSTTLGSHGNSSWHSAMRVAVDIHWVDPFIKNQITSPCLINLASQECISSLLFLHLPYSWWKWSVPLLQPGVINYCFIVLNVLFFLKPHFLFSFWGKKKFTSAL